jgi:hypothetical protein
MGAARAGAEEQKGGRRWGRDGVRPGDGGTQRAEEGRRAESRRAGLHGAELRWTCGQQGSSEGALRRIEEDATGRNLAAGKNREK